MCRARRTGIFVYKNGDNVRCEENYLLAAYASDKNRFCLFLAFIFSLVDLFIYKILLFFLFSVSDAWTVDEDVINPTAARLTADSVLKEHARWSFHLRSGAHFNSRHNRAQALQRLATQKGTF